MTTANLEVLNEYATDESDFVDFTDALGHWACMWTAEIAAPIARNARELFENRAVRGLVMQWAKLERIGREAKLRDFAYMVNAKQDDPNMMERNTWQREAGELSQALYFLLVQSWDVC